MLSSSSETPMNNILLGNIPNVNNNGPMSSGDSPGVLSTPRGSGSSSSMVGIGEVVHTKEKLIVIVDSIDNYKANEKADSSLSSMTVNPEAGVYVRVSFDNQTRLSTVKTFSSNNNPWNIKLGKRVVIPYAISSLNSGKLSVEVFETSNGEVKVANDKRLGKTEPIKINAFDMNHPVEFSLNLNDEIQVQFRFMRAPLANMRHYKSMERGIYSLLLKMRLYGDAALQNPEIDEQREEEEVQTRTPKILKSGFVLKKGQGNFAKWGRRYIELDDNMLLKYYASDSEEDRKEPLGVLVVDSDTMVFVPRDEAMEKELQKQKNIEKARENAYHSSLFDDDDSSSSVEYVEENEDDQNIDLTRRKRRELELRGPMLDVDGLYPYYLLGSTESEKEKNQIISDILESIEKEELDQSVTIKSHTKVEGKFDKIMNLVNPKGFKFSVQCQLSFSNGKEHSYREHQFITDSEEARKEWLTAICDHIILEEKRTDLRDPEEETAQKIFPYLDFFELLTAELPLPDIVKCFNAFQLNVSEKMVAPLLTLFDSSDSPRSSVEFVKSAVSVEVECAESAGTLFRRNSLSSKLVTLFFKVFGLRYLTKTIKPFLMKLIKENKSYEIDDEKVTVEEADRNAELLKTLCTDILGLIVNSKRECPIQIREVLSQTYAEAEEKYPKSGELCVGGLLFLRFFCPALVTPQLFGLVKDAPPKNVQRTLTLLTKILQNIANQIQVTESKKEKFMKRVESFTAGQIESAKGFLRSISEEPKKEVRENKEIIPEMIKLQSLEFIAHHFSEAFVKKYYNFEGDAIIEINFYKFSNSLSLISKAALDKKLKQFEEKGVAITKKKSQLKLTPSTRVSSPVSQERSPVAVASPISPATAAVFEANDEKSRNRRSLRSPSISVHDLERCKAPNIKKVDSSEWEKKREKRSTASTDKKPNESTSPSPTTTTTSEKKKSGMSLFKIVKRATSSTPADNNSQYF